MDDEILLANLQALMGRMPNFEEYEPASREHQIWLGQAHALVQRWNRLEANTLRVSANGLGMDLIRDHQINQIVAVVHRAVADLELRVPAGERQVFGPGDVYDFFNALRRVIASAENELLIVDPYLDATVIEHYLQARPQLPVRLLLSRYTADVSPAVVNYNAQHGQVIEARHSNELHDRVIFVDGATGWVAGQSLKDAAKAKPTYLLPLPPDVVTMKLQEYERIWNNANAI